MICLYLSCMSCVQRLRIRPAWLLCSRSHLSGRNKKPIRIGRTEPNRTEPSHDASEKRRPNRVEPGQIHFRTEPNRADEFSRSPEPKRIEPNRFLPDLCKYTAMCHRKGARPHVVAVPYPARGYETGGG